MMMSWVEIAALSLAGCLHMPSATGDDLSAGIGEVARAHDFSGIVLVRSRGRTVYARGFGPAEAAVEIRADDATPVRGPALTAPGTGDQGDDLWSFRFERRSGRHRGAERSGQSMIANAIYLRLTDHDAIVILADSNRADLDVFAEHIGDLLVGEAGS